jgi:long-chain acyl-CoA synthetase
MYQLDSQDYWRVLRDLVFSEVTRVPGMNQRLGPRQALQSLALGSDGLNADSLTRVQLATAVATLFNTFDVGLEDLLLAKTQAHGWIDILERAYKAGARDMTFSSSGTTGEKKYFRHAELTLWEEAQGWAQRLQSIERVVVMCPVHHIYGFIWGVLLPKALNVPVVELDQSQSQQWQNNDLVIGVPTQWEWLAARFEHQQLPAGVVGISSTSPMPDATRSSLRRYGPNQFFEIYGSSETAGIGARSIKEDHYRLMSCRIRQGDDVFMSALEDDAVLRSGALSVQDQLDWASASEFSLGNRNDGVVQVAGHNVSPSWVAAQIGLHAAVKESSVRLDINAKPARLKAFVVLKQADQTHQTDPFEQWLSQTLPHYALPQRIDYGHQLPRNAMGKLCDWA